MILDIGLWVDKQTGETYPRKLILGRVVRDGELKQVGSKGTSLFTFGVSPGREEDILNIKLWSYDADANADISKGEVLLIEAREESREYNGREYRDYVPLNLMRVGTCVPVQAAPKKRSSKKVEPQDPNDGFTDIINPENLPF